MAERERAFAPHCDQSVLHAPGDCEYCDHYPDWQELRVKQRIAFTNEDPSTAKDKAPCPSTYFRSAEVRDRWPGNRATGYSVQDLPAYIQEALVEGDPNVPCSLPPRGWKCYGGAGHGGSCAAWPTGLNRLRWMWRLKDWLKPSGGGS